MDIITKLVEDTNQCVVRRFKEHSRLYSNTSAVDTENELGVSS